MYIYIRTSIYSCICFCAIPLLSAETAVNDWRQARVYLDNGQTLEAAVALTELIDAHPSTRFVPLAYSAFVSMALEHENGQIPQAMIDAYSAQYPSIDSVNTPAAKWVVIEHYSYECVLAAQQGDLERAGALALGVRDQCRRVFEQFPNDQVSIGAVQRYTEMSRELGEEAIAEATATLETLVASSGYSAARWAAHFTLAWHVEITENDRKRATALRENLLVLAQDPGHAALMATPHPLYFVQVDCEYACGDALFRQGRHAEAIEHLDRASAFDYQGKPTELAHFKAQRARHMLEPNDKEAALERYEQHLNLFPNSARRADAHFHIGEIHERSNRPSKARTAYDDAVRTGGSRQIATRAQDRLERIPE